MCSFQVVVFLIVPEFHLIDSSGLEILFKLVGGLSQVLGLDVVAVFLVLIHLSEGLIEDCLYLICGAADLDITHFYATTIKL